MILVDAGMIAFSAYHALKGKVRWPLTFQIPRMIRSIVANTGEGCVLCWNADRMWKAELWPAYQAGRPEIWDLAGREDFDAAVEVLSALGAVQYMTDGLEADEVLAALAWRVAESEPVLIVSDDKDFMQLLSRRVSMRGRVRGAVRWSDVERIMGVKPAWVADLQALTGDPTDGVPKVLGPIDAHRLIRSRGHVRDWIDRDLRIDPRLKRRIEAGREQIRINLELVDLSRAAVDRRGAPGSPLLDGWGDLDRARAVGERPKVGWLEKKNPAELSADWSALRAAGERACEVLGV